MSAKSERERRREERLAAERAAAHSERRRLVLGYAVAGALTLAVIVGLVIVFTSGGSSGEPTVDGNEIPDAAHIQVNSGFIHNLTPDGREGTPPPALQQGDLQTAAREAGCELQLDLDEEGANHITRESEIPDYGTDPPTSGDHHPEQLADGAYTEMPELWWAVHSLEHGRIEIQYSPDLPEEDQLALKGVFDEAPDGMLMFPNEEMPYEVAVTAWTQLMTCDTYEGAATLDAIRDFRDIYIGQGPEAVPLSIPN
jgi:8-oxo-dGTP pyrophosphatase MutT (NUDIX family)